MRPNRRVTTTLALALLLAAAAPCAAAAAEKGAAEPAARHMEVPAETTCSGCHAEITPEVHDAWYAGAHGLNNVRCFVCHGSTGDDFRAVPSTDICASCHGRQAASLEAGPMAGQSCFSCHPDHRLSPHGAASAAEGEGDADSDATTDAEEDSP